MRRFFFGVLIVFSTTAAQADNPFDVGRILHEAIEQHRAAIRAHMTTQYQQARHALMVQSFDEVAFDIQLKKAFIESSEKQLMDGLPDVAAPHIDAKRPSPEFVRKVAERKINAIWERSDTRETRTHYAKLSREAFESSKAEALASLDAQYQSALKSLP